MKENDKKAVITAKSDMAEVVSLGNEGYNVRLPDGTLLEDHGDSLFKKVEFFGELILCTGHFYLYVFKGKKLLDSVSLFTRFNLQDTETTYKVSGSLLLITYTKYDYGREYYIGMLRKIYFNLNGDTLADFYLEFIGHELESYLADNKTSLPVYTKYEELLDNRFVVLFKKEKGFTVHCPRYESVIVIDVVNGEVLERTLGSAMHIFRGWFYTDKKVYNVTTGKYLFTKKPIKSIKTGYQSPTIDVTFQDGMSKKVLLRA